MEFDKTHISERKSEENVSLLSYIQK